MAHSLYMPMFWGDYISHTMHLSLEQHGAYLLLIAAYWQRRGPLPDDDRYLATVTKSSMKKWKNIKLFVAPFFDLSGGVWRHERIEKELLRTSERQQSAIANGRAGGIAKSKLSNQTKPKERKSDARAPDNGAAHALTPEQQDRRDRLMGEGKYDPLLKMRGTA